jgi:hypothetical protein
MSAIFTSKNITLSFSPLLWTLVICCAHADSGFFNDDLSSNDLTVFSSYNTSISNLELKPIDSVDLQKLKVTKQLRVRGWEISDNIYFGQTKVGGKWGPGLLIDHDEYVYGINHRGIQVLRRF